MSGTLFFVLPLPVNLANARLHWAVKLRKQHEYYAACDQRQLLGLVPPPPKEPWKKAAITATAYVARRHDRANLMHRVDKWPVDWLVTRGYLEDDSDEHLIWLTFPQQTLVKRSERRIELSLSPCA